MKTCLYLYTKSSEDVVFWQMLDYTINLKEGDIFEYNQRHYDELNSESKKEFNRSGAIFGKYIVDSTAIDDKNEHYVKYKSLFLKPDLADF